MQSFQILLDANCGINGRNPVGSEGSHPLPCSWEKGAWDRVRKGLVPLLVGGTVLMRDF
jgi:hypothetical protein